jgi:hypothetical protein
MNQIIHHKKKQEMKKSAFLTTVILSLSIIGFTQTTTVASNDTIKVTEPEYNDIFFLLDSTSGNLTDLERQPLIVTTRVKGMGWGGAESDLELKGRTSQIRFKKGQALAFIVRVTSQETDPHGFLLFYSLQTKKDKRTLEVAKAGTMGLNSKTVVDKSAILFNAVKYGTSSFKIQPVQDLLPGEYLLLTKDAREGFAFAVE